MAWAAERLKTRDIDHARCHFGRFSKKSVRAYAERDGSMPERYDGWGAFPCFKAAHIALVDEILDGKASVEKFRTAQEIDKVTIDHSAFDGPGNSNL
jgi:hypothetical protein